MKARASNGSFFTDTTTLLLRQTPATVSFQAMPTWRLCFVFQVGRRHQQASPCHPRIPARSLHSSHPVYKKSNQRRHLAKGEEEEEVNGIKTRQETKEGVTSTRPTFDDVDPAILSELRTTLKNLPDDPETEDLPKPPFMREAKPTNRFEHFDFEPAYQSGNRNTLKEKHKKSPFGLAFAMNPYANALAVPVRQCGFTGARLPRTCFQNFQLAENQAEQKLELLPLSLTAAMVSKKKTDEKLDREEQKALTAVLSEENSNVPLGTSSYLVNLRKAVEWVTEQPERRLRKKLMSFRMMQTLNEEEPGRRRSPIWREDMPEHLLNSMRRVVLKRLRSPVQSKKVASKEGMVMVPPGGGDSLQRLDEVDAVSCVLRLTPSDLNERVKPVQEDEGDPSPKGSEKSSAAPVGSLKGRIQHSAAGDAVPSSTPGLGFTREPNNIAEARESEDTHPKQAGSQDSSEPTVENEAAEGSTEPEKDPFLPKRSKTHLVARGAWSEDENKTFYGGVKVLPPMSPSLGLYFPTVRYRNRRVPIYSLPQLLGEEMAGELLKPSVFRDCKYAVMTVSLGTVDPQIWLMKLQAYLATSKENAVRL